MPFYYAPARPSRAVSIPRRGPGRYGDAEDEAAFHEQIRGAPESHPEGDYFFNPDRTAGGAYADWLQDRGRPNTAHMVRGDSHTFEPIYPGWSGRVHNIQVPFLDGGRHTEANERARVGFDLSVGNDAARRLWLQHVPGTDPEAARNLADGLKSEGVGFDDRGIPAVHDYQPGMEPPARNSRYRRGPRRYNCGPEYTGYGPPPAYQDPFVALCDSFQQLALAFDEMGGGC